MPNDATRAAAEALPEISRRRFLLNTSMAGAAVAVATPAVAMPAENDATFAVSPEVAKAFQSVTDARQELVAAKDALDWLADEWRHLWPRAPESMRWRSFLDGTVEKDIAGRPYEDEKGNSIGIKTHELVQEYRKAAERGLQARANASAKVKERHKNWQIDRLAEVLEMKAYLDETERLREVSGSRSVITRVGAARKALDQSIDLLMELPSVSLADLHIKAQTALIAGEAAGVTPEQMKRFPVFGNFFNIVLDVLDLAEGGAA